MRSPVVRIVDEDIHRRELLQERWQKLSGIAEVKLPSGSKLCRDQPSRPLNPYGQVGTRQINTHQFALFISGKCSKNQGRREAVVNSCLDDDLRARSPDDGVPNLKST